MKKIYFLVTLLAVSLLAITLVSAFWPFTGNAIKRISCNDSDSGNNATVAGVVKIISGNQITYNPDKCANNKLTEYYCSGSKYKTAKAVCKDGCENADVNIGADTLSAARCIVTTIPPSFTCSDSDSGINATGAGVVKYSSDAGIRYIQDICSNGALTEYSCSDSGTLASRMQCQGVCNKTNVNIFSQTFVDVSFCQPLPSQCSDSDGGQNYSGKGAVSTTDVYGRTNFSIIDRCLSTNNLSEGYCNGANAASEVYTCSDSCKNGVCTAPKSCIDSDDGKDYGLQGSVEIAGSVMTDFCLNDKTLGEFSCNANNKRVEISYRNCKKGCANGTCSSGGSDAA